jgi:glutathione S-transferase
VREVVYHLALQSDWEAAQDVGQYEISTLGRSLDDVGFIHCSASREQVLGVASAFYAGVREPLLLLTVDVDRLGSEVRYEVVAGAPEPFPHVYGPIPVSAVTAAAELRRDAAGFVWPRGAD